ncbi:MAG TPA: hypothetical protein VEU08_06560, partial [Vicinamibacterales bacterium]|nr:hypothetical protein [Vicinamibacterales bacterium]
MHTKLALISVLAVSTVSPRLALAQQPNVKDIVELELLTHTEVTEKLKSGTTTILLVAGGTEERGPQDVIGGHTIMARHHAIAIAKKLGNALVAPAAQDAGEREVDAPERLDRPQDAGP